MTRSELWNSWTRGVFPIGALASGFDPAALLRHARPGLVLTFRFRKSAMKALCWHGKGDIRCDTVPDPRIEDSRDVIIKVTSCAICGSDLHLMDGQMPTMESGDVLGHEFMGEVVEVGQGFTKFKKGDRIVVPFNINCGECRQCKLGNWSVCQRSNRNAEMAAAQFGYTTAGLFGYSHLTGGYAGGQAEYVRVPMADVGPMLAPEGVDDESLLFLTDILPTGWQGAEHCEIKGGEIIAIWGAGPVGLFAIQSAKIMGAERIIAIETVPERIELARKYGATDIIDFMKEDVFERIKEISKGEGADGVIDCVGMGGHRRPRRRGDYQHPAGETDLDRAPLRPHGGDQGRAPLRDRLDPRCLWWPASHQYGLDRAEGADPEERPNPCETLPGDADEADPGGEDRHDLDDHPPLHQSRGRPRPLQDVPGQEGRVREGGLPPELTALAGIWPGTRPYPVIGLGLHRYPRARAS